jgi:tetratricopeptide (TPR) repeat protein
MNRNFIMILMAVTLLVSCSNEKKLARKASNAVSNTDYEKAISYYDVMLSKDKNSYLGNAGKGIVLSEYLEKHAQAIPYLETALQNSPKKTGMKLNYDLGKGFHYL